MESLPEIKARTEAAMPGAKIDIVPNPGPANQPSLLLDNEHAAELLRGFCATILRCVLISVRTRPASIGSIAR